MSNALYTKFKESLLTQNPSIDLDTDTIKVALVNTATDYTFSAAHQFLSSVTRYSGTTDQTLATAAGTAGAFTAANSTFSAVAVSGSKHVQALVIYKDTGSAATSPLIAYIDTDHSNAAIDVLPNGGDIAVTWDTNIFAL